MSSKSYFTFTWNLDQRCENVEIITSPNFEDENLKGTKWYMQLKYPYSCANNYAIYLQRNDSDKAGNDSILVSFTLELIDSNGKIMKSFIRKNCSFSQGIYEKIMINRFEICEEAIFSIRCQITYKNFEKQISMEDPLLIQTQWKINAPGHSNWSKKIKIPFHECTHIDIDMLAVDDRINIQIGKVDLLKPYGLKITVLDDKQREIDLKGSKESTDKKLLFESWIEKEQLVDASLLHLPYSFTLICIISNSSGNPNVVSYSLDKPIDESLSNVKDTITPLQEDLKEMLMKEKHTDIKFRINHKIIPAHKCLLSARSPVFATMFDQEMSEAQSGVIDIPDVENNTLQAFLEFLYADTITITDCEEILNLLLLADKYQVDVLKDQCSKRLMSKLSLENVCQVIAIADMIDVLDLKLFAFDYIKKNKKDIISSPVWSKFMKQNMMLGMEILAKLISD